MRYIFVALILFAVSFAEAQSSCDSSTSLASVVSDTIAIKPVGNEVFQSDSDLEICLKDFSDFGGDAQSFNSQGFTEIQFQIAPGNRTFAQAYPEGTLLRFEMEMLNEAYGFGYAEARSPHFKMEKLDGQLASRRVRVTIEVYSHQYSTGESSDTLPLSCVGMDAPRELTEAGLIVGFVSQQSTNQWENMFISSVGELFSNDQLPDFSFGDVGWTYDICEQPGQDDGSLEVFLPFTVIDDYIKLGNRDVTTLSEHSSSHEIFQSLFAVDRGSFAGRVNLENIERQNYGTEEGLLFSVVADRTGQQKNPNLQQGQSSFGLYIKEKKAKKIKAVLKQCRKLIQKKGVDEALKVNRKGVPSCKRKNKRKKKRKKKSRR